MVGGHFFLYVPSSTLDTLGCRGWEARWLLLDEELVGVEVLNDLLDAGFERVGRVLHRELPVKGAPDKPSCGVLGR